MTSSATNVNWAAAATSGSGPPGSGPGSSAAPRPPARSAGGSSQRGQSEPTQPWGLVPPQFDLNLHQPISIRAAHTRGARTSRAQGIRVQEPGARSSRRAASLTPRHPFHTGQRQFPGGGQRVGGQHSTDLPGRRAESAPCPDQSGRQGAQPVNQGPAAPAAVAGSRSPAGPRPPGSRLPRPPGPPHPARPAAGNGAPPGPGPGAARSGRNWQFGEPMKHRHSNRRRHVPGQRQQQFGQPPEGRPG